MRKTSEECNDGMEVTRCDPMDKGHVSFLFGQRILILGLHFRETLRSNIYLCFQEPGFQTSAPTFILFFLFLFLFLIK